MKHHNNKMHNNCNDVPKKRCRKPRCIPEGCEPIHPRRQPCVNNDWTSDKCISSEVECVRNTTTYVCKKQQYLESTGIHTISEENSTVSLKKAVVSSLNEIKDVTCVLRQIIGQYDECQQLESFEVDTGKLNEYTGGDIEPCHRKLIQIEYVTKENKQQDKTVCEITKCCNKPNKKCRRNKCRQEQPCRPKHCKPEQPAPPKRCRPNQCNPNPCRPRQKPCKIQINYNKMLLFPLFPIRGAYIYPLIEPRCLACNCIGKYCKCKK